MSWIARKPPKPPARTMSCKTLPDRLLKNSVSKPEYILMSASFHRLAGDLAGYSGESGEETYDDRGSIDTVVFSPAPSVAAR